MPIILSLALAGETLADALYGAGPDGLFLLHGEEAVAQPQPMSNLYCCATVAGMTGQVLLTGGAPHGVAWRDPLGNWQAGWMDYTDAPVLQIAPAPHAGQSGVLLAATDGAGILRTTNRGQRWVLCNYGLREFTVLSVAWAPPPPAEQWPSFEVVFAGTERGLYRSPAAGLGWQQVAGVKDAIQALAVSPRFHSDGTVLAGGEAGGLLRSVDGGRSFAPVAHFDARVDALLALQGGWLAATPEGISVSPDATTWALLSDSPAALCLLDVGGGIMAGGTFGFARVALPATVQA
jgi:hypothetical protein